MFDLPREMMLGRTFIAVVGCALLINAQAADDAFATVDGERITAQEFQLAVQAGVRKRFYHGKIPEDKMRQFREEVGQQLVDRVLLVKEADRRNITADKRAVEAQVKDYQGRLRKSGGHTVNTEMLAGLRQYLEEEDKMAQLERSIKDVAVPDNAVLQTYYRKHPEYFTTPERVHASIILLKVDPGAGSPAWTAAQQEAGKLLTRLRKGAEFAELARIHSGDESAAKGGDLGFLHAGMLAEPAQQALAKLQPGQLSEPVLLLQGVALFKLEAREAPKLNEFNTVAARAGDLWRREQSQTRWREFVEGLRKHANIQINTSFYRDS